jgi:hypothetical protein
MDTQSQPEVASPMETNFHFPDLHDLLLLHGISNPHGTQPHHHELLQPHGHQDLSGSGYSAVSSLEFVSPASSVISGQLGLKKSLYGFNISKDIGNIFLFETDYNIWHTVWSKTTKTALRHAKELT